MTDLRDAARQALAALDELEYESEMPAIAALRAALEQQEQAEPVAYRFQSPATEEWLLGLEPPVGSRWEIEPLYTHPPCREWRGLSEEEIEDLRDDRYFRFARAVEAALRSKNHE